jgi:hypothetical protein
VLRPSLLLWVANSEEDPTAVYRKVFGIGLQAKALPWVVLNFAKDEREAIGMWFARSSLRADADHAIPRLARANAWLKAHGYPAFTVFQAFGPSTEADKRLLAKLLSDAQKR